MKSLSCNKFQGEISANPSKSHFIRLLLTAWLYGIELEIINPCAADDCLALINILRKLNSNISNENNKIIFKPGSIPKTKLKINTKQSATLLRMLSAITALTGIYAQLNGSGTLLKRNFSDIIENLQNLNVKFLTNNNLLPFTIQSKIQTPKIKIDASQSSQFLSGLLIAMSKSNYTEINAKNLVSKSYIDLTLETLKSFGIEIQNLNYEKFILKTINLPRRVTLTCESDWSGASFWLVAGAINGNLTIHNLNLNSKQGDKIIIDILKNCGANLKINKNKISIQKSSLKPFEFDATDYPDLVPPLIPLALASDGKSIIYNVDRLTNKESNRLNAIITEYRKLNANIKLKNNKLIIEKSQLKTAQLKSHNDHRIAMSLIISSTLTSTIKIDNLNCIKKSYPNFLNDFKKLGGNIHE